MAKRRVKAIRPYTKLSVDEARLDYLKKEPLRKQGQRFTNEARNQAPKRTNKYASGLTFDYTTTKDGLDAVSCWGGKDGYTLTHILENGTTGKYGQSAHPHMRPAHDKTKSEFGEEVKDMYVDGQFIESKQIKT